MYRLWSIDWEHSNGCWIWNRLEWSGHGKLQDTIAKIACRNWRKSGNTSFRVASIVHLTCGIQRRANRDIWCVCSGFQWLRQDGRWRQLRHRDKDVLVVIVLTCIVTVKLQYYETIRGCGGLLAVVETRCQHFCELPGMRVKVDRQQVTDTRLWSEVVYPSPGQLPR